MNKKEYLEFHRECIEKMHSITQAKNSDYTGDSEDPFENFRKCERDRICSTETGFYVRLSDKFSRIASFLQKGIFLVKDESIEDTLLDMANYLILMGAYIKSKKKENVYHAE